MSQNATSKQRFTTRYGFLLSALGIAIGTGNIWRFPRIVAQNGSDEGGGAFIIVWVIFLFIWSIPLIIGEYALGIHARKGVIGTVIHAAGKRFAWMGVFMTFTAMAITFFYSVVLGWCVYYMVISIFSDLPTSTDMAMNTWNHYQSGLWPLLTHGIVMALGGYAIWKGIGRIERINRWLIPTLILIILIALIRAVALEGSSEGIRYLFTVDWRQFSDPNIWVAALTQNAWDTGAGWGLFITYGAYMQLKFGIVKNAVITAVGNNLISMICAIMIFGTCFAILGNNLGQSDAEIMNVMQNSGPASTGLTFIWMPQLFEQIFLGKYLTILFFLGLSLAGFSSLISQLEMSVRTFIDGGISRSKAILIIVIGSYIIGIPSALFLDVLSNQDFVWGLALLISGGFCAFSMIKFGTSRIRSEILSQNEDDIQPSRLWDIVVTYFVPAASILLLIWWLIIDGASDDWYNPFAMNSVITCVAQWSIILIAAIALNNWIVRRTVEGPKQD